MSDVTEKPVWRLTSEDIDVLTPAERQWAINHLQFLKDTGTLALLLANPKGTKYETTWEDGRWKLKPIPQINPMEAAEIMRTIMREEIDAAFAKLTAHPGAQP